MHDKEPSFEADTGAVVLLSGGLDSSTVLAMARAAGRLVYALSFDYGQRHASELRCAEHQARTAGAIAHEVINLRCLGRLVASASALVAGSEIEVPVGRNLDATAVETPAIPSTYVPARNTLFLSWALAWAEALAVGEIWIGANALDYSGYPDCRPEFLHAYEAMAHAGTRAGIEGQRIELVAPLLSLRKHDIIARGAQLGVDYANTVSCYDPRSESGRGLVAAACGRCESCNLRRAGFERAGVDDPTRYG